jgi:hypothetical protein
LDEQQERSLFLAPAPAPARPERDEPPAGPAAPLATVEGGRRRRLQVVVVVALLVAGVLVNRSGNERAEEATVDEPGRTTDDGEPAPRPPLLAPTLRTTTSSGRCCPS